ncbi:hypothetical protein KIPE111705_21185 [Kibdelosporangium persicum]|uniref:Uncharacterized protein n=1 Tax=Kibdelosporangium persicum TaxID=2698649 RepID=A0ABX2FGF9_9PSEU|nr:hypothetical protein [Kibdelosporangium persicum]NRN70372.1 hypothetical protein [Kibdelosporangium persicum]
MTQLPIFGQPPDRPAEKPAGDRAVTLQVLVTVKAAPNPSEKYGETVCVAGLSTDPERPGWVRLYPINFRELGRDASFKKYDIVSVEAVPARQDSRRESWRPRMPTLKVTNHLKDWARRRRWLDPAITEITMCRLHRGATMDSQSLGLIRPKRITALRITRHPGWSSSQQAKIDDYVKQITLFGNEDRTPLRAPRFAGTYHYECQEPTCRGHKQGFIDWEFVAFQLLRLGGLNDTAACEHLERRFLHKMCAPDRDVAFYVGNVAAHPRTFSVLGVYYPPRLASVSR